jgi:hypothetical protein
MTAVRCRRAGTGLPSAAFYELGQATELKGGTT